jgi:vacuolar-type H+-ATPase subunit E/Vma4
MIGAGHRDELLAAVQAAELRAAREEAEAIRCAGDSRAEQIMAQARAEAASLIHRRCAAAERLAELEERDRLAEIRASARATVLRAQHRVLSEARAAAHAAIHGLAGDPRLDGLLEPLAADAQERLAAAGRVELAAVPDGGFIARAGSRQIDYSLSAHLDRWLDATAGDLESLWR